MAATVAKMTQEQLRNMIEAVIEQKLEELLGDPDEGRPLLKSMRDRLLRQKKAVAQGLRGEPLDAVARRARLK
jgi:hypothetical protein